MIGCQRRHPFGALTPGVLVEGRHPVQSEHLLAPVQAAGEALGQDARLDRRRVARQPHQPGAVDAELGQAGGELVADRVLADRAHDRRP